MKKDYRIIIYFIFSLTCTSVPASELSFKYSEIFNFNESQLNFRGELYKAQESRMKLLYDQYLSNYLPHYKKLDCKIEVQFTDANGYWGHSQSKNLSSCDFKIELNKNLSGQLRVELAFVHELMHFIRAYSNKKEVLWLNEGLAQLVETQYIGIWPQDKNLEILTHDSFFLSDKDEAYFPNGPGYNTSYIFMKYLYNHFGGDHLVRELLSSPFSGWDNILSSIQKLDREGVIHIPEKLISRKVIWKNFAIALLLNNPHISLFGLSLVDYSFENKRNESEFIFQNLQFPNKLFFNTSVKENIISKRNLKTSLNKNLIVYIKNHSSDSVFQLKTNQNYVGIHFLPTLQIEDIDITSQIKPKKFDYILILQTENLITL